MSFIVVCTFIDNDYASLLFSQTFFRIVSACWASLQKDAKVCHVQVAHLHNVARTLLSLSRCFQLSTNLDRDFFRYLWYCGKTQIECRLAWHLWHSTDLGLCIINWHVFLPIRMQKLLLVYYYSAKSHSKPNLERTSKYNFSPDLGGKNGGVPSMSM